MNLFPVGSRCPWKNSLFHSWICKKTLFLRKEFPGNYLVLRADQQLSIWKSSLGVLHKSLLRKRQVILESRHSSHVGEGGMQLTRPARTRKNANKRSHYNFSVQVLSSEESCIDSAQLALSEHCTLLCRYASATCQWEKQTGRPPPVHQACWAHWNQLLSQEIEEVTRGSQAATSDFKQGGTGWKFIRGR